MSAAFSHDDLVAGLWERADLSWKLRPEQQLLKAELESIAVQLAVFEISRRWGKTYTLVVYCIEQAMRERQKIRYGCAFLSDLEEFILPAFELILEDCPPELRPVYIRSRKVYLFPNGSEVKLVGLDKNPNGLRGNGVAKIVIDEAGYVSYLRFLYTSVIIPATAKQPDIKLVFLSTPPPDDDHYFHALADKARGQPNGYYKCLTIDDISDLDPRERERLLREVGGEHSPEAQREFFCKAVRDPNYVLVPEFREDVHVVDVIRPEFGKYWLGGDIGGVRDKSVVYLCTYDFLRGKTLILDERAFEQGTSSTTMMAEIKAMVGWRSAEEPGLTIDIRWIDCPGQTRVDYARDHGFHTIPPPNLSECLEAHVNQVRVAFTRGLIEIDRRCTFLIKTLRSGRFNKLRTDLERSETLGHCDGFMALSYSIKQPLKSNPYPPVWIKDPHKYYVPEEQKRMVDMGNARAQTSNTMRTIFGAKR